jgi:hypothetical protein
LFIYNKWKKEGEPPEACHGSDNDSDEVRDSAMADEDG